jgi:hypothetical protein
VNAVNTVGRMGEGIALEVRVRLVPPQRRFDASSRVELVSQKLGEARQDDGLAPEGNACILHPSD